MSTRPINVAILSLVAAFILGGCQIQSQPNQAQFFNQGDPQTLDEAAILNQLEKIRAASGLSSNTSDSSPEGHSKHTDPTERVEFLEMLENQQEGDSVNACDSPTKVLVLHTKKGPNNLIDRYVLNRCACQEGDKSQVETLYVLEVGPPSYFEGVPGVESVILKEEFRKNKTFPGCEMRVPIRTVKKTWQYHNETVFKSCDPYAPTEDKLVDWIDSIERTYGNNECPVVRFYKLKAKTCEYTTSFGLTIPLNMGFSSVRDYEKEADYLKDYGSCNTRANEEEEEEEEEEPEEETPEQ